MATNDLLFRITGDNSSQQQALIRAEMAQRRYDSAVMSARSEMDRDLASSAAKQSAAQDKIQRDLEQSSLKQRASLDKLGTVLLGIGTAAAVGLGLAGKAAMDWESAWAGVTKTVDSSSPAFATLEQDLRDLALTLPATHGEIAAVAEAAGALGVETGSITAFTKTMINLAETTNLSAEEAATSIAQMMNVMGTAPADVERLGSTLVALGNAGASTEADILAMAQRISGAAAVIKLTEGETLGWSAALADVGIEAEAGGSAISKVFINIADAAATGGDSLDAFARVAGMSAEDFSAAFRDDPSAAMQSFVAGLGSISDAGGNVFATLEGLGLSEVRVRDALLRLSANSDGVAASLELQSQAWADNTALVEEAAQRYETTEAKMQMARNALVDAGISLGEVLLPVLAKVAEGVGSVASAFAGLPSPVQNAVVGLGGIVAVGGLVLGAGLKMHGAMLKMLDSLSAAPGLARAATGAFKGLAAAGIFTGIMAGAVELGKAIDMAKGSLADVSMFRSELVLLGGQGQVTGELLQVFGGDLTGFMDDLSVSADGVKGSLNNLVGSDSLKNIAGLDAAFASMHASGDVEYAATAYGYFESAAAKAGVSAEEFAARMPLYNSGLAESAFRADEAAAATDKAGGSMTGLGDDMADLGEEAADASEEIDTFAGAISDLFDEVYGLQEAQDALSTSVNTLKEDVQNAATALAEGVEGAEAFNFALSGNSQAAIDNRDRLREMSEELGAVVEQNVIAGDSQDEVTAKFDEQRETLVWLLEQQGYNREEVEALIIAQGDVQPLIETLFSQPGMAEAQADADFLKAKAEATEGPWTAAFTAETAAAASNVNALNDLIHYGFNDKTVTLTTVNEYVNRGSIPEFATGAWVTGPTVARIGEGGESEAVIPEGRLVDIVMGSYDLGQVAAARAVSPSASPVFGSSQAAGAAAGTRAWAATPMSAQSARGVSDADITVQMGDVYNPVPSPAPDSAMRQVASVAALGLFGRDRPPVFVVKAVK